MSHVNHLLANIKKYKVRCGDNSLTIIDGINAVTFIDIHNTFIDPSNRHCVGCHDYTDHLLMRGRSMTLSHLFNSMCHECYVHMKYIHIWYQQRQLATRVYDCEQFLYRRNSVNAINAIEHDYKHIMIYLLASCVTMNDVGWYISQLYYRELIFRLLSIKNNARLSDN